MRRRSLSLTPYPIPLIPSLSLYPLSPFCYNINMKKIPYGIANYEKLKKQDYYFIDKTHFIEKLESLGSQYLFFLRPRRFGKSLFVSILEHYYDVARKGSFDELFKDTYIGKNPTPLRNSFPVLKLNFSGIPVDGSIQEVENSFNFAVKLDIEGFFNKYVNYFPQLKDVRKKVLSMDKAADVLNGLIKSLADLGISYYLLIDEYDNFANNILIEHGRGRYRQITHAGGFLRSFFAVVKNGTENRSIERLFVTGVSPLVLSDVTSGMNIGDNISTYPIFEDMVGFTENEVEVLVDYYIKEGAVKKEHRLSLLDTLKSHCNNYCFSVKMRHKVFNSDMVLYIVKNYMQFGDIPDDPIDPNIRTDYGKLRFLVIENNRLNGNFNILQEVLKDEETTGTLIDSFAIEEIIDKEKFRSLLYYLGLLTIGEAYEAGEYKFIIPNNSVRTLLWEYLRKAIQETYNLRIDVDHLKALFRDTAYKGKWKPLFEFLFNEFYKAVASIRDFIWREEGVVMFLKTYLSLSPLYIVEGEYETSGGYADIYLRKNWPVTRLTKYEYLIEVKYIKHKEAEKDTSQSELESIRKQAIDQLERYASSRKFTHPSYVQPEQIPQLKKIVIIASSKKVELMEEVL